MTTPEPHLVTPLAYLGYYDTVDKSPYDHINSGEAIRLFVQDLPGKEDDYLDALRCYATTLYGRMLQPSGRSRFLDKTPAYGLVLPFLQKLFPHARYVVLSRHPLAIMSSYANSFFSGDWQAALDFNPIIARYVPAMAKMITEAAVPLVHVRYEDLVDRPEDEMQRIFAFLELENQLDAVNYGSHFKPKAGPGDPISVSEHNRPVRSSRDKWAIELANDPAKLAIAQSIIAQLDPNDLKVWGNPMEHIFDALEAAGEQSGSNGKTSRLSVRPKLLNKHTLQRRILLRLRKDIHNRPLGKAVKKIRYYCNVLLRE